MTSVNAVLAAGPTTCVMRLQGLRLDSRSRNGGISQRFRRFKRIKNISVRRKKRSSSRLALKDVPLSTEAQQLPMLPCAAPEVAHCASSGPLWRGSA